MNPLALLRFYVPGLALPRNARRHSPGVNLALTIASDAPLCDFRFKAAAKT